MAIWNSHEIWLGGDYDATALTREPVSDLLPRPLKPTCLRNALNAPATFARVLVTTRRSEKQSNAHSD